jgi:uncharacterized protein (DUF433 family)
MAYDDRMSTTTTPYVWLARNPKSSYQQLFVKGTRIPARVLYGWYACADPQTPEEIAADYGLPLDAVKEAIAYCESDPPELHRDLRREEALMEATGMNEPAYKDHGKPRLLTPRERTRLMGP